MGCDGDGWGFGGCGWRGGSLGEAYICSGSKELDGMGIQGEEKILAIKVIGGIF